jgi:hypothetical protein
MKMLHRAGALTLVLLVLAVAARAEAPKTYRLSELAAQMEKVEKQEIVLTGTIVGVCKSGCKMWVSDGPYKEGDLFALVRAKDDAFKFEGAASGKSCTLKGYAVGEYMDYCAEEAQGGEAAEQARKEKETGECKAPVTRESSAASSAAGVEAAAAEVEQAAARAEQTEAHAEQTGAEQAAAPAKEKKLKEITFFATTVEYGKSKLPPDAAPGRPGAASSAPVTSCLGARFCL